MKKSYKSTIFIVLVFALPALLFLFAYVSMKIRIDSCRKERVDLQNKIVALQNEKVKITADYQTFVEDSLRQIAKRKLHLVEKGSISKTILIDKNRIEEIEEKVSDKYEH